MTGWWAAWLWRKHAGLACHVWRIMGAGPLCPDHLDLLAVPGQEDAVVRVLQDWLLRPGRAPI